MNRAWCTHRETATSSNLHDFSVFKRDLEAGKLPAVSYIKFSESDEHAPADVAAAQAVVHDTIESIRQSSVWHDTAIILTYDESGGWWDHVAPPGDQGVPTEEGMGPRVPALVISPFSKRGHVSHVVYDHTSILKFIEWNFGLESLNARDARANNLLDFFDFGAQNH